MPLFDEFAADAAAILEEAGRELSFRGVSARAMVGDQALGFDLERGGMVATGAMTIKLLYSEYSDAPPLDGERITYAGTDYRINSITYRQPSAWYVLACEPAA